jgi:transposase
MSNITLQRIGSRTYIRLSEPKWNKANKRCDNIQTPIGKIDSKTGKAVFKPIFIESLTQNPDLRTLVKSRFPDANLTLPPVQDRSGKIENYPAQSIRYGLTYFLYHIAQTTGLISPLQEAFPDKWKEIFTLASYLICENDALMYCEDFVEDYLTFNVGRMTSSESSNLLLKISEEGRNKFTKLWYDIVIEEEFVSLDSSSHSSYSEHVEESEWGKNKDNLPLKQVNTFLLCGLSTKRPIKVFTYNGSLRDVSVFQAKLSELEAIVGTTEIKYVMDKGFYSELNVKYLLDKKNQKFLMAVPFTSSKAKEHAIKLKGSPSLSESSTLITTNSDSMRGIHTFMPWVGDTELHVHFYLNPWRERKERDKLQQEVRELLKKFKEGKIKKSDQDDIKKFLVINKHLPFEDKMHVVVNETALETELETAGCFILLSNWIDDAQEALNIYRSKDFIEKSFEHFKEKLGLERIHLKNSRRLESKFFVAFVALILISRIYQVMSDARLFKKLTYKSVIRKMRRLSYFYDINKKVTLNAITKEVKNLFEIFKVSIPCDEIISDFIKML